MYKHLHANPELSMQETATLAQITGQLEEFGYTTHQIGGGVVEVLANGEGPTVLFRADFDALPVKEETGLPYASTATTKDRDGNEQFVMHACGHDFHVAAHLGAAKILAHHRDAWSGTYLALFQPGEETGEGAVSMMEAGLTDTVPTPDVALGQHVVPLPASHIQIAAVPVLSTAAMMKIVVHGKGSHGSMPHFSVDPIVLASAIITRIQSVVAREIDPSDFGVITVGAIHSGTKANVIPSEATMLLNFRAYSSETLNTLIDAVKRIVHAECTAARCPREPEFFLSDVIPPTENDTTVTEALTSAFTEHFGAERVSPMTPATGSEDFSTIPQAFGTPYCYWFWGGFDADSEPHPNHSSRFAPALQPTLSTGTEAALTALLTFLKSN
nr:amidohydrolase [Dermatophilus congolensis]